MAEVLITLGLIGIVAAMTIPQLIKNYQIVVLQTQFKKAYSDLNSASKMFQVHNGMTVSEYATVSGSAIETLNLFKKEFNTVLTNDNRYTTVDDEDITIGARPYKDKDGNWYGWGLLADRTSNQQSLCDSGGFFFDVIGRVISSDDVPKNGLKNGPKVCIDINGEKGPNIYGVDYFVFLFTTDGYVIPFGQPHKDNQNDGGRIADNTVPEEEELANYCNNKSSSYASYASCSYYAISNTHPSKSNKDYWHDFINGR